MFSFHKPRVYRSSEGCCICRAKSSSSRFTDCRKYESDLEKCFDLKYPRHGEICNACVLLVKRYKRLPLGSNRHWGHVVDARAGPGTKSLIKYKKIREDAQQEDQQKPTTSVATGTNAAATNNNNNNHKSLIPEKFSKIFKKSKKNKTTTPTGGATTGTADTIVPTNGIKREGAAGKRKAALAAASAWESSAVHAAAAAASVAASSSLPGSPDSLDSDYEDTSRNITSAAATATPSNGGSGFVGGTIVQFQTQTRASSYRSRNSAAATAAAAANAVAAIVVAATQRKPRPPLKVGSKRRQRLLPRKNRRSVASADETALFFDNAEWQPRKSCCGLVYECEALGGALLLDMANYKRCATHGGDSSQIGQLPTIIATTMPAIVQLAPPAAVVVTPTPVLKKHHLFYKRQSECFPQGDLVSGSSNTTKTLKSEISTTTTTTTTTTIHSNGSLVPASNSACLSSSSTYSPSRHSTAKITTITPLHSSPLLLNQHANINATAATVSGGPLQTKSHNFLHKIKAADTGKIVKHSSLDKISNAAAVRLRPADLQEMKHAMKTVDKSYVLAAAAAAGKQQLQQQPQAPLMAPHSHPTTQGYLHPLPMPHPLPLLAAGVGASTARTSSASTKFSDNSSDSGFDENMLDRKSASPLQEDTDKKMLTRPSVPPMNSGVQTLFLASGIQVQGDIQNVMLAGNEVAARIIQHRRQKQAERAAAAAAAAAALLEEQQQQQLNVSDDDDLDASSTTRGSGGLKIAQIGGSSTGSHSTTTKTRAIYNNNQQSSIQHENGVTTIVPASSLAASSQTAAMNALTAPSTVTITPAQKQKLPNLQIGSNIGNNNNNNVSSSSLNQQKVILVKTAAAASSKYIHHHNNNNNNSTISASGIVLPSTSSAAALNSLKNGL